MEPCKICALTLAKTFSSRLGNATLKWKYSTLGDALPLIRRSSQRSVEKGVDREKQLQHEEDQKQNEEQNLNFPRPKSFKELVEMQKREEERRHHQNQLFHHSRKFSNEDDDQDNYDNSDNSHWSIRRRIRRIRRRFESFYRREYIRWKGFDQMIMFLQENLRKQRPDLNDYDLLYLVEYGMRSKQTEESCLVMFATRKQMYFYGHPLRKLVPFLVLTPQIGLSLTVRFVMDLPADSLSFMTTPLGSILMLETVLYFGFIYFLIWSKMSRAVWFDPRKGVYSIHLPYKGREPITFRAGEAEEIDDFFANVKVRGVKALCPPGLFRQPEHYDKLFRQTRRKTRNT